MKGLLNMKTKTILYKLSKKFPKSIAKKYYDFPGLQIGKLKNDINSILLCLDFDDIVFNYMKENDLFDKIDLIITHHPFIFGTYKQVLNNDPLKLELTNKMLEKDIPIYSYHTNFDEGKDGMNDALANKLNLLNIRPLISDPMARGGELEEEMDVQGFSKFAKERLNVAYGELIDCGNKIIKTVAIVGGGGWHSYLNAKNEGYDIFISGDIPHHGRRGVVLNHYNYLNLPHEIEKIFMEQMERNLLEIDASLKIYKVDHEELPKII